METQLGVIAPLVVLLSTASSHAQNFEVKDWSVVENKPDQFYRSLKSTFIARTQTRDGALAIRCLDGGISLELIVSEAGDDPVGSMGDLKIAADEKSVQDDVGGIVKKGELEGARRMGVQFGDAATLDYLEGAQNISIRFTTQSGVSTTVSFPGGQSLTNIIGDARKACGL